MHYLGLCHRPPTIASRTTTLRTTVLALDISCMRAHPIGFKQLILAVRSNWIGGQTIKGNVNFGFTE